MNVKWLATALLASSVWVAGCTAVDDQPPEVTADTGAADTATTDTAAADTGGGSDTGTDTGSNTDTGSGTDTGTASETGGDTGTKSDGGDSGSDALPDVAVDVGTG